MAARAMYDVQTLGREVKLLPGSFDTNSTSSPVSPKGKGFTVARTGVGTYTITLQDVWADIVTALVDPQCNSAGLFQVEVGAISVSGKTVVVRTLQSGAAADVAANANNRVNFHLVLANSPLL